MAAASTSATPPRRRWPASSGPGDPFSGSTDPQSAGNGSIMRLAAVPMFFAGGHGQGHPLLGREFQDDPRGRRVSRRLPPVRCRARPGAQRLRTRGRSPRRRQDLLGFARNRGHRARRLSSEGRSRHPRDPATWSRALKRLSGVSIKTGSFEEAVLRAANLGDDADTTAAVCGQIAGAFYGVTGIPQRWLGRLAMREEIERAGLKPLRLLRSRDG